MPLEVACGRREGYSRGVRQRADAALAEGEVVGAACSGVRYYDETGRAIRRLGLWD